MAESIKELIQHFSVIQNRHDHGLIDELEYLTQLKEVANSLNALLWPKEKVQPVQHGKK